MEETGGYDGKDMKQVCILKASVGIRRDRSVWEYGRCWGVEQQNLGVPNTNNNKTPGPAETPCREQMQKRYRILDEEGTAGERV